MMTFRQRLFGNLFNILGWRSKRKLIVIESDDWGSIRMPSIDIYQECLKKGYRLDRTYFSRYDSLASEEDLSLLFEILMSFRDKNLHHPIITANCLVANPDFDRIRASNYSNYYYELITETFSKYPKHKKCFNIWQEGLKLNIFKPQSHGREHLNVSKFMTDLKAMDEDAHFAFNFNMPGINRKINDAHLNPYLSALEYYDEMDKTKKASIIEEGLHIFKSLFGYNSESFIAPNYIWHSDLEHTLYKMGVRFIQGSKLQNIPKGNYKGYKSRYHYLGEKNAFNQLYLTRNVFFEPTLNKSNNILDSVMKQIEIAFKWGKPAIISTHRVNFVGFISPANRDRTLFLLRKLIKMILDKWPEVEFISTTDLGDLINRGK